ncbi:MAG: hypothetical protein BMS9Abin05_1945 [Rhodothermia bacterium]|nr:MAG: hypothetical protein BMS9Abin05_1945 [Rhodothermia bacterium]
METERDTAPPQETQSPPEGGRMDRIADQTRGLIDDIKEWIDLKVQLVQLELEERFESLANHIVATLLVIVLAFTTVLFALIAAALAIGNWLGDPLWGFLIVTGGLALITVIVHLIKPKFIKAPWKGTTKRLPAAKPPRTTPRTARLPQVAETTETKNQDGRSTEAK